MSHQNQQVLRVFSCPPSELADAKMAVSHQPIPALAVSSVGEHAHLAVALEFFYSVELAVKLA